MEKLLEKLLSMLTWPRIALVVLVLLILLTAIAVYFHKRLLEEIGLNWQQALILLGFVIGVVCFTVIVLYCVQQKTGIGPKTYLTIGVQLIGGIAILFGLLFTALNVKVLQEGRNAEFYARSITQLGDAELQTRMAGIRALEQIADKSESYRSSVDDILCTFIRAKCKSGAEKTRATNSFMNPCDPDRQMIETDVCELSNPPQLPPDVQAVLNVFERRKYTVKEGLNLERAYLVSAEFRKGRLDGAYLPRADLRMARIGIGFRDGRGEDVNLNNADLFRAFLQKAVLTRVNLDNANLSEADLESVVIANSSLKGVNLFGANLRDAIFFNVDFGKDANFKTADLRGARFYFANLSQVETLDSNRSENVYFDGTCNFSSNLRASSKQSGLLGTIDTCIRHQVPNGKLKIIGWAADLFDEQQVFVWVFLDGRPVKSAEFGMDRRDVVKVYTNRGQKKIMKKVKKESLKRSGWVADIPFDEENMKPGDHHITAKVYKHKPQTEDEKINNGVSLDRPRIIKVGK